MRNLRVFMIFLGSLLLLAGCISSTSSASTLPQKTAQPVLATKTAQFAFAGAKLKWGVDIVQNEMVLPASDGKVELQRKPFTIRVKLPVILNVKLNVIDNDINYQRITPGFVFPEYCNIAFCPGMGIAEDNKSTSLFVDGEGTHSLYYIDDKNNRWSRIANENGEVVLERDVAFLNQELISETTYQRLYMVFLIDYREKFTVNEDEVTQVILLFK